MRPPSCRLLTTLPLEGCGRQSRSEGGSYRQNRGVLGGTGCRGQAKAQRPKYPKRTTANMLSVSHASPRVARLRRLTVGWGYD